MMISMKRAIGISYLKKYPTLVFVLWVALGVTLGGSLLNNAARSKETGVIERCARSAKSETRDPQDCVAEKTVKGFPVKTTVSYKIIQKPTDEPAVSDNFRVRYSSTKNPLVDAVNYLIAGSTAAAIWGISMLVTGRVKKRRTQKIKSPLEK